MKSFSVCLAVSAILVLAVSGCTSTESTARLNYDFSKIDKIAVVDVVGRVKNEGIKNQISDLFTMELLKKGYTPIERSQVQTILKEQDFQKSEITTAEDAVKAGRILNVPVAMIVSVPEFKDKMSFTAKMVDVEDGSVFWVGAGEGETGKMLSTIFGAAAGAAVGVAVSGDDSTNKTVGGVAGGVLGGVAGNALSPQASKKAREIIRKICKDLPHR
ncbi:MAG: CsgG/HfaB family protein [Planctomycetota bacterium]|jgi:outer membrane lipoprotein SlyB